MKSKLVLGLWGVWALTSLSVRSQSPAAGPESLEYVPLDALPVQAVENFRNPKLNQLSFYVGYLPLNPYYTGFSPGLAYTLFYTRSFAWDIIDASFVYTIDKGLTSELADRFRVNPKVIDRLKYTAFTHAAYVHSYGKSVVFGSMIRYFRSALFAGPGIAAHARGTRFAVSYGLRLETYTNESFSLKAELRNITTFTQKYENHASINLGSSLSF